jgi:hypothetical protein
MQIVEWGARWAFGQKETPPTFCILSNYLYTTFSYTSHNPNSLFASLMKPYNLKDSTLDSSKVSLRKLFVSFVALK